MGCLAAFACSLSAGAPCLWQDEHVFNNDILAMLFLLKKLCGLSGAVPVVEREPEEPPPFVVLVQGPPQASKN